MTAARAGLPAANTISRTGGGGRERPRVETATLLARLERQRTMLEKQLGVWTKQKQKTEQRLAAVEAQIEAVCGTLNQSFASRSRPEASEQTSQRNAVNHRF